MNANIICTPQRLLKVTKAKRSLFKPLLTFLWTTLALVFYPTHHCNLSFRGRVKTLGENCHPQYCGHPCKKQWGQMH